MKIEPSTNSFLPAVLHLNAVCKHYDHNNAVIKALDCVSLCVRRGEYVAVTGPSGSGKSTFLNIAGCLDAATSGQYYLLGTDISSLTSEQIHELRKNTIGFVFQAFNLLPKLSVIENVTLPLIYQRIPKPVQRERAVEALCGVGMADYLSRRPKELSGGQQQRVAIARVIASSPNVIFADEPTGALDPENTESVMLLFEKLVERGITVVLVTHDREVACRAKRILRFEAGKIVDDLRNCD